MYTAVGPKTRAELWVLPLVGDKKPRPFLRTEFDDSNGQFSPDGMWVAYESDESGRNEVYVRPFSGNPGAGVANSGGKWQISTDGGIRPFWRRDGKELYYLAPDGKVMAVEVASDPAFRAAVPHALFQAPSSVSRAWDVTSDGKRFLFVTSAEQGAQAPFTVMLNWQAALRK
jgi:Tol biopolymer transport system component